MKAAEAALDRNYDAFVEELVTLTQIPAPPFKEETRAAAVADRFRAIGLRDVTIDKAGNVLALRPGSDPDAKAVVVSAHLDTVFPEGTDVTVRREGTKLHAPGVGDDTRGLATILAWARALDAGRVRTRAPILFVATVGEEGLGNSRGARYLITDGAWKDRIAAFFSVDGADATRIVHHGVGSKRYHVVFSGPGGHSYGAFGLVNPMAAMANAVAALYRIDPPKSPKTTYSASVTGGGTSVNAIPAAVWVDIDMRSESAAALGDLDRRFVALVNKAVADENAARSTTAGAVRVKLEVLGERPAGETPPDAAIVRAVQDAVRAKGMSPSLAAASTDANMAMASGVPGVTIGSGGSGGRAHAPDEWTDVDKATSLPGMQAGLNAVVAVAGAD